MITVGRKVGLLVLFFFEKRQKNNLILSRSRNLDEIHQIIFCFNLFNYLYKTNKHYIQSFLFYFVILNFEERHYLQWDHIYQTRFCCKTGHCKGFNWSYFWKQQIFGENKSFFTIMISEQVIVNWILSKQRLYNNIEHKKKKHTYIN